MSEDFAVTSRREMLKRSLATGVALGVGSAVMAADAPKAANEGSQLSLTENGKSVCKLVILADEKSESLLKRSAALIAETVKKWTGSAPAIVTVNESKRELPTDSAVVFATFDTLKKIAPNLIASYPELAEEKLADEQGYLFVPVTVHNHKQLFVVSHTPRGTFNGAVYLRDFHIDGSKENLYADFKSLNRSPEFRGRPAYVLTIWGYEAKYTAADWHNAFAELARDGVDRVYFWVSGHFPSKKYPETYKCLNIEDGKAFDTTVDTKIGTVEDLQAIVRSAHELGLQIYLGGALGSWCGTTFLTKQEPETMKQEPGTKSVSLCPSHPKCRKALVEYYQEVFSALPDADGLFIESADEAGDCKCSRCDKKLDDLGSRQFGQSQLSLCQEIMAEVWKIKPDAKFGYTIGYQEHKQDIAYYREIAKLSKDPRFEWMEARDSWSFPGEGGKLQLASTFSDKVMRWKLYELNPLDLMVNEANRAKKEGAYGQIITFSPGYGNGSFYKDFPFPTDILPFALTGFVYRELAWEPATTIEEMHGKIQKRFFGKEAPKNLGPDVWKLREIIRSKKGRDQVDEIEKHIKAARVNASPKTNAGLDLMSRAVTDIRKYLPKKAAAKKA